MKKVLSSALVALMVVLSGCTNGENSKVESKISEEQQIVSNYERAVNEDSSYVLFVDKEDPITKSISKDGFGYCSGLPKIEDVHSRKQCTFKLEKIGNSGLYAKVVRECQNQTLNGSGYLQKDAGVWKVLVLK